MITKRYNELMQEKSELTEEEIKLGWHFCNEFDGLLVGPGMKEEQEICQCFKQS